MNLKELSKIFGKPLSWCYAQQKKYVITQENILKEDAARLAKHVFTAKPNSTWFLNDMLTDVNNKLKSLEKRKYWLSKLSKNHKEAEEKHEEYTPKFKDYDIQQLKKVPIDRFVKVDRMGFFKLRNENTASVYWKKDKNTWRDFGSGEYGDVIDLVQKLNGCSFPQALETLDNAC